MNKKIILTLVMSIFLISLVSGAISNLGTFEDGECIDLPQTCDDCSYNNITKILFPNNSLALENVQMDKDDTFYNYTFCNTESIGFYKVNGFGDPSGVKTTWNYVFEVTQTGQSFNSGQSLTGAAVMFGSLIVAFFFMFLGFKLGQEDTLIPVAFLLVALSVALVIYSLFTAFGLSSDIVQYTSLSELTETIFITILWTVVGIFVLFIALMLISFIKELGRIVDRKRFGDDWNPLTHTYE